MKRQPSECGKIIPKETTGKESIYKIYKQFIQLNTRKTNNPIKKWGKDLNRYFSKEGIQIANKHMKNAQHCLLLEKLKKKNYNEIPPHISQNFHHQNVYKE